MFGFRPAAEPVETTTTDARTAIQNQIQDMVSSLPPSALTRPVQGPAAVRQFMIGGERYRIVVDVLPPNEKGEAVPVATVERVTEDRAAERTLRQRFRLTEKETRVAVLLAQRRSNAEIADSLGISPHTARRHTENVMLKLNVTSRYSVETALTARA